MKKFFCFAFLICLLVSVAAFAQDSPEPLWELSQVVEMEEFDFRFDTPANWLLSESDEFDGITIEPTEGEFSGYSITLSWIQRGFISADDHLGRIGCNLLSSKTHSVNVYPAISAVCEEMGIWTFWESGDYFFILSFSSPNAIDAAHQYTWDLILESIRTIISEEIVFADEPYVAESLNRLIFYPQTWLADIARPDIEASIAFYELESDVGQAELEGAMIEVFQVSSTDLGDASLLDIIQPFHDGLIDVDSIYGSDNYRLLNEPGVGFGTVNENGVLVYYVSTVNSASDLITIWALKASHQELLETYAPVFLTMLWKAKVIRVEVIPEAEILVTEEMPEMLTTEEMPEILVTEEMPEMAVTEEMPNSVVTEVLSVDEAAGDVLYQIDQSASRLSFSVMATVRGTSTNVIGETNQVTGELVINFENPEASQLGTIRINARSLTTAEEFTNRALRSQILQSSEDEFEFIVFTPTQLNGLPQSIAIGETYSFEILGDLTILNISNPVSFATEVSIEGDSVISGTATATVLYSDWDISIPNIPNVPELSDEVTLSIEFVARAVED
jgi:polyisoprenoid-binding protein YceI